MLCLKVPTDAAWIELAMRDLDGVLVDHAHCEMKAASNALSLAARHPDNARVVRALTDLAREEIDHFQRVFEMLAARGLPLGNPPVDEYANELRRAAHAIARDASMPILVDRLLIGALIEARSCERFKLLIDGLAARGDVPEMVVFYKELFAAEARHYRTFVDLANDAAGGDEARVTARLERLAEAEGAIVSKLSQASSRATVHG
jgi:tRNA-(ms[2]io[6]A)-hydroxylase